MNKDPFYRPSAFDELDEVTPRVTITVAEYERLVSIKALAARDNAIYLDEIENLNMRCQQYADQIKHLQAQLDLQIEKEDDTI